MALNIKDPVTDEKVRQLARATGESITDAVRIAVEERLERVGRAHGEDLVRQLTEIARRAAALPVHDARAPDEIIGYDRAGLPA